MPKKLELQKVMVIGSGPIVIGQAAEFDYAGTQACRALKEEGLEVVLVNSNPATIMTDDNIADRVYIEPLTPDFIEEIIAKERPDGLLPTLGGQVGLNLAVTAAERGVLERYGVKLLGTPLAAIKKSRRSRVVQSYNATDRPTCAGKHYCLNFGPSFALCQRHWLSPHCPACLYSGRDWRWNRTQ